MGLILLKSDTVTEDQLIEKYNIPVPRYTSYPTVPGWKEGLDTAQWQNVFAADFSAHNRKGGISLYLHLPFCESLCTYCGCNKKITTNHSVEDAYIDAIHREWQMYVELMDGLPVLRELHLGGGTPTFFSPANLRKLLEPILNSAIIHEQHEFSFEGHPNNTTSEHLQALFDLGFRRLSYGVQDNDPEVQRIINRIQPIEHVKRATENARALGYTSVNFDLIYGLPRQTLDSITRTINEVISLRPDRIAFYSYAHVPWTSRGQRLFDENDLPGAAEKLALYLRGKQLLTANGYRDIGMDHFALETDDLFVALQEGRLHRNFMGYTTQQTEILIGLGVSSISTTPGGFAQNEKTLHNYYELINQDKIPVQKGLFTSAEDRKHGRHILDLICTGHTIITDLNDSNMTEYVLPSLRALQADGLVVVTGNDVQVTPVGKPFIRNICSAFDLYIARSKADAGKKMFSNAV